MITHLIGDSHVNSFRGWNIKRHYLGAVTLKRMGYLEEKLLDREVKKIWFAKKVLFCFGEIDVRCFVKVNIEKIGGKPMNVLLHDWVDRYARKIKSLGLNRVGLVSVTPPSDIKQADTKEYPVRGSNEERALYTKWLNLYLKEACILNDWEYVDTYSRVVDERGMLPKELSDGTVHIKEIRL